jgi:hypothetical protein
MNEDKKSALREFIDAKSCDFWVDEILSYKVDDEDGEDGLAGENYICNCEVRNRSGTRLSKRCFVNKQVFEDWNRKRKPVRWEK